MSSLETQDSSVFWVEQTPASLGGKVVVARLISSLFLSKYRILEGIVELLSI
jgi:hypothetical protein